MSWFFGQWRELLDLVKYGSRNKGFFVMIFIGLIVLYIVAVLSLVAALLGKTHGGMQIVGFAFVPVVFVGNLVLFKILDR